jgi:DNA-binding winged helix-turn-helix (wHTH) protein
MTVIARFGQFSLDSDRRQLALDGREIHLTPKAFDLLVLLAEKAGRGVRKPELHERIWPGTFVSDATLVSLVKELRRALNDRDVHAPIIRTAHGVGYAFAVPLERPTPQRSDVSRWVAVGGRRIPLQHGENSIGRDPTSMICLDIAGVSRRHARIVVDDSDALLEDVGSKNGTSLEEQPVTGPTALQDGDWVHIGPIAIMYRASATGISTETVSKRRPQSRGTTKAD